MSNPIVRFTDRIIQTRSTTGSGYLENLDGLRAVAAVFVLVSHVPLFSNNLGRPGVLIFFTLSGFLLYRGLLDTLDRHGLGARQIVSYLARRLFRIVPLYVFFVAFYAFVDRGWTMDHKIDWFLGHALFLASGDLHLWTLKTEIVFYLALPLLVLILVPLSGKAARIAILCVLIVASWYWFEEKRHMHQPGVVLMVTGFLVGMLAVHVYQSIPRALARVLAFGSMAWILAISIFVPLTQPLTEFLGLWDVVTIGERQYYLYPATFLLVACLCRFRSPFYSNRLMRLTGVCGYGFYLWHVVSTDTLLRHIEIGYPMLIAAIVMTFGLALVSYIAIEAPGIRAGKRVSRWILEDAPKLWGLRPVYAALLGLALVGAFRQYFYFDPTYHFQLDLWASNDNFVQLFIKDDCCYSKDHAAFSPVVGRQWQSTYLPMEETELNGIRIDPGAGPVKFRIRRIAVKYPFRDIEELDLTRFKPNEDVGRMEVNGKGVLEVDVPAGAIDPILYYQGPINTFVFSTRTASFLFGSMLFVLLVAAALLVDRFSARLPAGRPLGKA